MVGAGTMGVGIARWFAQQRVEVALCDVDRDTAEAQVGKILEAWERLVARGKLPPGEAKALAGRLVSSDLEQTFPRTDLVVEAVVERQEVKVGVFKLLEKKVPDAILATNTSSLSVGQMQREMEDRKRFLGLHFFNPAHRMKLVEVVLGPETSPYVAQSLVAWLQERGKEAVVCRDSPGFIVNRVARNFYGEAFRTVGQEREAMEEHDRIMREVGGFPMGPFELMDLIGIDVNFEATQSIWKQYFFEPRFAPHPLQRRMVEEGKLGRKSGEGFYRYD